MREVRQFEWVAKRFEELAQTFSGKVNRWVVNIRAGVRISPSPPFCFKLQCFCANFARSDADHLIDR